MRPVQLVLFYKNLICPGGAERLVAQELKHLTAMGYRVALITYRLNPEALFDVSVPADSIICLERQGLAGILALSRTLTRLGRPPVLSSSGHSDVVFASALAGTSYALHLHHPCFMSFNDFDKYSLLLRRHYEAYLASNFGASRFREIRRNLSPWRLLTLNVRVLLSRYEKRRSKCSFVLSNYARREKQDLYGIDAHVAQGALEEAALADVERMAVLRHARVSNRPRSLTLLTMARLDVNKRIDELIRAVHLLRPETQVSLDVVGDGPERPSLESLTEQLGLAESVRFHGHVPDAELEIYFRKADLFVSIDWADYKLTLFEALAQAVPVLVSDETECDARLLEKRYVQVVSPTARDVAAALRTFAEDPVRPDANQLVGILRDYTWDRYFRTIAQHLTDAGMLAPRPASRREAA